MGFYVWRKETRVCCAKGAKACRCRGMSRSFGVALEQWYISCSGRCHFLGGKCPHNLFQQAFIPLRSSGTRLIESLGLSHPWRCLDAWVPAGRLGTSNWLVWGVVSSVVDYWGGTGRVHPVSHLRRLLSLLSSIMTNAISVTGEIFDLEALSKTCKELNRYSFFVTSMPLNRYAILSFLSWIY